MSETEQSRLLTRIRMWLVFFIVGLILSGITAFPLERETGVLNRFFAVAQSPPASGEPALYGWLRRVHEGIVRTNRDYPFMAYGTDWLAFAHLVIAVAFLGPLRDPVRNQWVLVFGVIACLGVFALGIDRGAHSRDPGLLAIDRLQFRDHRSRTPSNLPALCSPDRERRLEQTPSHSGSIESRRGNG